MRSALLCLLLLYAGAVHADTWFSATVKSHHFDNNTKDYEQSNWGAGLEHDFAKNWKAAIGFYRNSQRIDSTYMLAVWTPYSFGPIKPGIAMGIITGYTVEPELGALPVLAVEQGRYGFNIIYVPPHGQHVGVAALQLKFKF